MTEKDYEFLGKKVIDYVKDLKLTPDLDGVYISFITNQPNRSVHTTVIVTLHTGETLEFSMNTTNGYLPLRNAITKDGSPYEPVLWTPEHPYLYQMTLKVNQDVIETYFALRTIEIQTKDEMMANAPFEEDGFFRVPKIN